MEERHIQLDGHRQNEKDRQTHRNIDRQAETKREEWKQRDTTGERKRETECPTIVMGFKQEIEPEREKETDNQTLREEKGRQTARMRQKQRRFFYVCPSDHADGQTDRRTGREKRDTDTQGEKQTDGQTDGEEGFPIT